LSTTMKPLIPEIRKVTVAAANAAASSTRSR
jgi:hypothetical protein